MAKIQNLEIGDVVRLKSGGPKMTIALVSTPQTAEVMWFNGSDLRKANLTIGSLIRIRGNK